MPRISRLGTIYNIARARAYHRRLQELKLGGMMLTDEKDTPPKATIRRQALKLGYRISTVFICPTRQLLLIRQK